jgi:hypothetical protein
MFRMTMTGIKSSKFSQLKTYIHSSMKLKEFYQLEERILEFGIKNRMNFYQR